MGKASKGERKGRGGVNKVKKINKSSAYSCNNETKEGLIKAKRGSQDKRK